MNVSQITDLLNAHDIKPSYQRIKVYEVLIRKDQHSTAESIYKQLIEIIPTLSKTTIYNTLKKFVKNGIINVVAVDNAEMLYDAILDEHGHFKCRECGKLYNFDIHTDVGHSDELEGFAVKQRHVLVNGVCKNCNEKMQA